MTKRFTPGPLEAIGNLVRGPMSTGGFLIAECRDGNGQPHSEEATANARMAAAAPELFAALERLLRSYRFIKPEHAMVSDAEKLAVAALAKATGEQA